MRPTRRLLLVTLALLLAAPGLAAHGSVPAGYQTQSRTSLASGVDHEVLTRADPAQTVHVARVAPDAARFVAVSSYDVVANQADGAELPSAMCHRVGCYAGINGDFSGAGSGAPVGGVVSAGRLLRSPVPGRPQLNVRRDGRLTAGPLDWSATVSGFGRTVPVRGINVAARPGEVVLYTPEWGGLTPEASDLELVVRSSGPVGAIGASTLEIVGVRTGSAPVPADGAVLAASGSAAAALHEFADRAAASGSRTLELRIVTTIDVVESVGGSPVILQNGQPAFPDVDEGFTRGRHPRSLVGWNGAGEVVLVTVDGGRDGASGMTLAEAADLLRGLGATEGFGFNHASATFVAAGEVKNLPVDDDPAAVPNEGRPVAPGHFERPALNAFMAVPRPAGPPPSAGGSGARPGSGGGGTTATTAPAKATTAGGSSGPGTAVPAAPGSPSTAIGSGGTNSPSSGNGQRVKQPRTRGGKKPKGNGSQEHGEDDESTAGPAIPDWNDITAALQPHAVPGTREFDQLTLDPGLAGGEAPRTDVGRVLLQLLAAGLIGGVGWGLRRAYDATRPARALWL